MKRLSIYLAATLLATTPALAQDAPSRMMYGWHGGWGMMLFGPLFMVLVVGGIVALAVWLLRGPSWQAQPPGARGRDPLDILKERFARGEIDKDEFEERRRILER
jgi:putative membrane protein